LKPETALPQKARTVITRFVYDKSVVSASASFACLTWLGL